MGRYSPSSIAGYRAVIDNFGPIKHASIEFGDFTAIVAPNSTGKTFTIIGLNRLHLIWNAALSRVIPLALRTTVDALQLPSALNNSKSGLPDWERLASDPHFLGVFSRRVRGIFESPELQGFFARLFTRPFGCESPSLISYGESRCRLSFSERHIGELALTITPKGSRFSFRFSKEFLSTQVRTQGLRYRVSVAKPRVGFFEAATSRTFRDYALRELDEFVSTQPSLVFIPSERVAAPAFEGGRFYSRIDDRKYGAPLGSGVERPRSKPFVWEFLSDLDHQLALLGNGKSALSPAAQELLGVSVRPTRGGTLALIEHSHRLDPNLASSGISQLLPLVALAEAHENSFLYIEEPEVDLHVAKQIEVARYLWDLGKPLVLTTHSPYVLMKMAHLAATQPTTVARTSFRIFALSDGRTAELGVHPGGRIDVISSIADTIDQLLDEIQTVREPV